MEESETIVSAIALPALLLSVLAAARLMGISKRTASIFMTLNATIGLAIFSALITIPQLSIQALNTLNPEKVIMIMPLIFTFELLSGTYFASRILELDYLRFLKLTLAALSLTLAILVPVCLLALLFKA